MRKFAALVTLTLGLAACATNNANTSPDDPSAPQMQVQQLSSIAEVARHVDGGMPVKYRVRIVNPSQEALTVTRVSVQSVGQGAYTLRPYTFPVDKTIEPDHYEDVEFTAPAYVDIVTTYGANGPVTLRLTGDFKNSKGGFRRTEIQQVGEFSGNEATPR